jgi:phospholipid transport system substrate-binding protein
MLRYAKGLSVISVEDKAMPRHVLRRLAVALLGVALLAASPGGSRADEAGAAAAFLASLTDQVIEQLTDASLPVMERERRFRSLFRANFDIPAIGRFVLGRYWRKARPEVRKDFLSAFEEIMAQGFAARFAGYADTKFEVVSVQALKRAGQFKVRSRIAPTKDEVYLVGWLVEHKNGQFRVLDAVAEGVSMALTLRSEYASVIKRSGGRVEGLVAQLHEHIEAERLLWVSNEPSATPP